MYRSIIDLETVFANFKAFHELIFESFFIFSFIKFQLTLDFINTAEIINFDFN